MKKTIIICFVLFGSLQFINAQTKSEKKEAKAEKEQKEYNTIQALINTNMYVFEADWATTQKGRRVNLIGDPNYLKINNKTAEAQLPYFGVVQRASLSGDAGIKFESELAEYKIENNDKKKKTIITSKAKNKSEQFSLTLTVYHGGSASLYISSNSRNGITYDGNVAPLEEIKK